ncbi:MFS transporter [Microbacterium ulmi]|uniref:MFS transporter n=1 Tax=Microbacterium ulmi TaxID=179095 RepID=A0A7Y2M2T5_9MICO|nr:MFS transporter [Microbacterium ulmi]NII69334.1 MFS family permease [Microbacterium ulmi]NNH04053.1 MFS transporter [Microbacterium ulmi]
MTALTSATASTTRGASYGFALAIVSLTAMMAGASAPSPFYPVLAARIGFDAAVTTTVFAVYALALLATLLTAGSLSDHVGRRPVASVGLVLLAASVFVFWNADSTTLLVVARLLQGVASGLLLSSVSAAIADLEPASRPGSAAVWNAVAPMAGLALGALVAGVLLDAASDAFADVFAPLTALYLLLAALVWLAPETAPRRPGALASLRFRVGVPRVMRPQFLRSVPAIFAGWATGGLFLSLGATIVHTELGGVAHVWQGLSVGLLAGSGSLAAFLIRRRSARTITIYGTTALAVGTVLMLIALAAGSLPGYLAAVVVAGSGFGTAFFGVVRSLAPHIPADQRADVFAVLFLVSYVAFGLPAVIAGVLVQIVGLGPVVYGYGAVVVVLAGTAAVLRARQA